MSTGTKMFSRRYRVLDRRIVVSIQWLTENYQSGAFMIIMEAFRKVLRQVKMFMVVNIDLNEVSKLFSAVAPHGSIVTMERIVETAFRCYELVPLLGKLLLGSGIISYIWLKRVAWRSLNDRGIPVITPRLFSFGTAGHYVSDNGYPEFAKAQLLDQDRKTVGYYRVTSPVVTFRSWSTL